MNYDPLQNLFDECENQEQREIHQRMKEVKLAQRTPEEIRALARKILEE